MTYQNIYDAALKLVCEGQTGSNTADYADRATYILGNFYTENIPLEKKLDTAAGDSPVTYPPNLCVTLANNFPFKDVMLSPAVYYLAAMLVIDENETLYEQFFERYVDAIATIQCGLMSKKEPIKDCYQALKTPSLWE